MVSEITHWITELMRTHGQLSVFIGVMIEQIIVPIPSPIIILGAGAILISPHLSIPNALFQILWIIILPGFLGETLGSYIGYTVSYYGGKSARRQAPVVPGRGLGWDRKFREAIPWKERSLQAFSLSSHPGFSNLPGFRLC
jgi:membrane protein DedA with SNARE-associated domain